MNTSYSKVGLEILRHLYFVGETERRMIDYIFKNHNDYSEQLFKNKLSDFKSKQYLKINKEELTRRNTITITNEGLNYLQKVSTYYLDNLEIAASNFLLSPMNIHNNNLTRSRVIRSSQIQTIMKGCGVKVYADEKPYFETILNESPKTNVNRMQTDISPINVDFEKGIYYSKEEILQSAKAINFSYDSLYRSRFFGVLLSENQVTVCYNCGDKVLKITPADERVLLANLKSLFSKSKYARSEIKAVIFGEFSLENGISTYTTGFVNGEVTNAISLEDVGAREAMHFLTGEFCPFSELYYVAMDGAGFNDEKYGTKNPIANLLRNEKNYVKYVSDFSINSLPMIFEKFESKDTLLFNKINRREVLVVPIPELKILSSFRLRSAKVDVLTFERYADTIAKCLCRNIGDIYNMSNQFRPMTDFVRYNKYGYAIHNDSDDDNIPDVRNKLSYTSILFSKKQANHIFKLVDKKSNYGDTIVAALRQYQDFSFSNSTVEKINALRKKKNTTPEKLILNLIDAEFTTLQS